MNARRWNALLWAVTGTVAALLLVKFFVGDVYRVDSGSMRPTLFGGRERPDGDEDAERVFVLYGQGPPARFDLVVIRSSDGEKPLVKRVCGLPGDQDLMIRDGDLFIGRKRLPSEAARPAPVPVFDDRYLDPELFFEFRRDGSVRREGGEWVVDGEALAPGNLLRYHPELRDGYLDRRHRLVPGVIEVNDARLALEFALEPPRAGQVLRFQLTEEGDLFEAALELHPQAGATLRLLRHSLPESEPEQPMAQELERAELPLEPGSGRWFDLEFSNIDNHLRLCSRALALDLGHDYAKNESLRESGAEARPAAPQNLGPRVRFGVQGGRARFRAVRVLRDLFYTEDGRYAVRPDRGQERSGAHGGAPADDAISLGPDDYFLLGDNSAASTDSRHFGPRKAADLLGRPLFVLWPRLRVLEPREAP